MLRVGRKRTKNLHLPPGVIPRGGRWYWQPTSKRERDERRAKGLPLCVTLGDAGTKGARERWANVSGFNDAKTEDGTVDELLTLWERDGIELQPNGTPRAESTIAAYRKAVPVLRTKFGACRYGKTEHETSRGQAIGPAEIQSFIADNPKKIIANRYLAVFDNAFQYGIRKGRTTYNPCLDVVKNASKARTREPLPWEVECLRTLAGPLLGLQMDFEAITGWRVGDMLQLTRAKLNPDGIRRRQQKTTKDELWEWTPELRRIVAEAASLRGATSFPASPVFPSRRGTRQKYNAFNLSWQALKRRTNAALAACEVPLRIEDLHFHDLRSKAHDDAEEAGLEGHELLGNTRGTSRRHYRRRARKVRALG